MGFIAKMVNGLFGDAPTAPPPPPAPAPAPPPPPKVNTPAAIDSGVTAAQQAAAATGMSGTVATGPGGLTSPANTGQKTLLGA